MKISPEEARRYTKENIERPFSQLVDSIYDKIRDSETYHIDINKKTLLFDLSECEKTLDNFKDEFDGYLITKETMDLQEARKIKFSLNRYQGQSFIDVLRISWEK